MNIKKGVCLTREYAWEFEDTKPKGCLAEWRIGCSLAEQSAKSEIRDTSTSSPSHQWFKANSEKDRTCAGHSTSHRHWWAPSGLTSIIQNLDVDLDKASMTEWEQSGRPGWPQACKSLSKVAERKRPSLSPVETHVKELLIISSWNGCHWRLGLSEKVDSTSAREKKMMKVYLKPWTGMQMKDWLTERGKKAKMIVLSEVKSRNFVQK